MYTQTRARIASYPIPSTEQLAAAKPVGDANGGDYYMWQAYNQFSTWCEHLQNFSAAPATLAKQTIADAPHAPARRTPQPTVICLRLLLIACELLVVRSETATVQPKPLIMLEQGILTQATCNNSST